MASDELYPNRISEEEAAEGILSLIRSGPEGRETVEGEGDAPDEGGDPEDEEPVEDSPEDDESEDPDDDLEDLVDDESEDEEDDEDADDETSDDEPETFTVHVDGKPIEVTLEEALQGYQRTSDYTRKTMELTEQRKALREQEASVGQQRQEYLQRLALTQRALQTIVPQQPDQALKQSNPQAYKDQLADYTEWAQNAQAVEAERQRVVQEHQAQVDLQKAEHLEQQRARLLEIIPEWHDPEVRAREGDEIVTYAQTTYGATLAEIESVEDARWFDMVRKAMLHDRLAESGTTARKKVKPKQGKALKPGTARKSKDPGKRKAKAAAKRLRETGSTKDAAEAILQSGLL